MSNEVVDECIANVVGSALVLSCIVYHIAAIFM